MRVKISISRYFGDNLVLL